jgi:GNAT superfamily N-acetyltransferase
MKATCWLVPCRIWPRLIQHYLQAALTTLRRQNRAILTDAEAGRQRDQEAERSLKRKRTFATLQLIRRWTRQGIGSALLARCIGDARSFGIRRLHCFSTLNAERFYWAAGFNTVGLIDVQLGPDMAFPAYIDELRDCVVELTGHEGTNLAQIAADLTRPVGRVSCASQGFKMKPDHGSPGRGIDRDSGPLRGGGSVEGRSRIES